MPIKLSRSSILRRGNQAVPRQVEVPLGVEVNAVAQFYGADSSFATGNGEIPITGADVYQADVFAIENDRLKIFLPGLYEVRFASVLAAASGVASLSIDVADNTDDNWASKFFVLRDGGNTVVEFFVSISVPGSIAVWAGGTGGVTVDGPNGVARRIGPPTAESISGS